MSKARHLTIRHMYYLSVFLSLPQTLSLTYSHSLTYFQLCPWFTSALLWIQQKCKCHVKCNEPPALSVGWVELQACNQVPNQFSLDYRWAFSSLVSRGMSADKLLDTQNKLRRFRQMQGCAQNGRVQFRVPGWFGEWLRLFLQTCTLNSIIE